MAVDNPYKIRMIGFLGAELFGENGGGAPLGIFVLSIDTTTHMSYRW
jgi:hypothetical protein